MNTLTLGVRNALRNTIRSTSLIVILGFSVGLCLVMLIAHQAVSEKINSVKRSVGNTITITPAGFSAFSQANNTLSTSQLNKVAALAHITNVSKSLTDRLTTIGSSGPTPNFGRGSSGSNNTTNLSSPITLNGNGATRIFISGGGNLSGNFSLPISVLGTTAPLNLNGAILTLSSGTAIDGIKDQNSALVSSDMANKNNLKVGSTFTAYSATITVAGIFTSSTKADSNTIIMSLPTTQRLTGQSDVVTNAVATVDSLDHVSSATTAIKNILGSNADIQNSQDKVSSVLEPLQNIASISLMSLMGAVVGGSIVILLAMVIVVRERRREIGILKAIGASNTRVIFQFISEAVTLTLAGAIIGVLIAIVGGNPVTNLLVSSSANNIGSTATEPTPKAPGVYGNFGTRPTGGFFNRNSTSLENSVRNITTNIGWNVLAYGLAAALGIAVIGSACTGWMIARIKPSEVMRME